MDTPSNAKQLTETTPLAAASIIASMLDRNEKLPQSVIELVFDRLADVLSEDDVTMIIEEISK